MTFISDLEALPADYAAGALTIGNFDGVHRGHVALLDKLVSTAREAEGPAVVFTFDPHPVQVLRPEIAPTPITWLERKVDLLREHGVDLVVVYPTERPLLELSARDFFDTIVRGRLGARSLVEGANFCFGHQREGTLDTLRTFCASSGIGLEVVESTLHEGEMVSSSRIRGLIGTGDMSGVTAMLARPHRVRGVVVAGASRGTELGFPTANLEQIPNLVPAPGVYAGRATWDDRSWPAAIHVGGNPTFAEATPKFEVHLVGFEEDLYGELLVVDITRRLRGSEAFESAEALRMQLRKDVEQAVQFQVD